MRNEMYQHDKISSTSTVSIHSIYDIIMSDEKKTFWSLLVSITSAVV